MSLFSDVREQTYVDSVRLMRISEQLESLDGVTRGNVAMATESNRNLLREQGLYPDEVASAGPEDLVIVFEADDEQAANRAFNTIDSLLTGPRDGGSSWQEADVPTTLDGALQSQPEANLALISVPGQYAWYEAQKALNRSLNVMLFSDNVPLDREIMLKEKAVEEDLLMMGPDAGTALINGYPLGFANRVNSGPVGLVSASGTGLQEVSTLIHRGGSGITQGIGVGGRDLHEKVGGRMMIQGLEWLEDDSDTDVIVLISKPPSDRVARQLIDRAEACSKPVILNFLGYEKESETDGSLHVTRTLEEAATTALEVATGTGSPFDPSRFERSLRSLEDSLRKLHDRQKYIRGLYTGGTLCSEAQILLGERLPRVYSNVSSPRVTPLDDPWKSQGHTCVDLGEDEFTQGRAHPMIDPSIREDRLLDEARDPETAMVLLDFCIGYGSHENPAGALAPVIGEAREQARRNDAELLFMAHVCGTESDPQDLNKQESILRDADVEVFDTNAQMARAAARLASSLS